MFPLQTLRHFKGLLSNVEFRTNRMKSSRSNKRVQKSPYQNVYTHWQKLRWLSLFLPRLPETIRQSHCTLKGACQQDVINSRCMFAIRLPMSFACLSLMQFCNQTFIYVTLVQNLSPKTLCSVLMVSQSIIINLIPVSRIHLHGIFNMS